MDVKTKHSSDSAAYRKMAQFFGNGAQLDVGFFADSGMTYAPHPTERIMDVAMRNEFGGKNKSGTTVLPRPFMRRAQAMYEEKWNIAFSNAIKGRSIVTALKVLGTSVVEGIRRSMSSGDFEPLEESYLQWRKRHGINGDKPLIATGRMRDAVEARLSDIEPTGGPF